MGLPSFILGIAAGIVITFAFIIFYIGTNFGWDFFPVLFDLVDGNVSFQDIMSLGRYFGYI